MTIDNIPIQQFNSKERICLACACSELFFSFKGLIFTLPSPFLCPAKATSRWKV